ncbi:hypothetical protein DAPPUDRAFT_104499 [Daphnia pulex]|uniref:Uncharacterized protein n=1 Tax=Daphnia pulex TaxID=6669 RepID=E9GMF0_DAPPU|nr:hypothetical protein DAPPUDRAFT_120466 [Daphnia pulex]EFX79403.1 hypothetical protein DAPPUDRAFT_104499 [Daphnia pulex]|eukprot:EFX62163.1 hypothetical protein DAPPUDRAFT_120466 [Daphnia pulex]
MPLSSTGPTPTGSGVQDVAVSAPKDVVHQDSTEVLPAANATTSGTCSTNMSHLPIGLVAVSSISSPIVEPIPTETPLSSEVTGFINSNRAVIPRVSVPVAVVHRYATEVLPAAHATTSATCSTNTSHLPKDLVAVSSISSQIVEPISAVTPLSSEVTGINNSAGPSRQITRPASTSVGPTVAAKTERASKRFSKRKQANLNKRQKMKSRKLKHEKKTLSTTKPFSSPQQSRKFFKRLRNGMKKFHRKGSSQNEESEEDPVYDLTDSFYFLSSESESEEEFDDKNPPSSKLTV